MDGQQFDRIARSWGRHRDRRDVLRLLAAALLAGWGCRPARHAAAQVSAGQVSCTQDAECGDSDLDLCTGGACVDGLCTYFIVDCIPGYTCCGNGACCPAGEAGGCLADTDCVPSSGDPCEGARCEG